MTFPKIELHVHLEGTVRPETLLEIARRDDYALPAETVDDPPMFDTDLNRRLRRIGEEHDWRSLT